MYDYDYGETIIPNTQILAREIAMSKISTRLQYRYSSTAQDCTALHCKSKVDDDP